MLEATRKRVRDADTTSFRSNLVSRVTAATPQFWRDAASTAGVRGIDAFLVHLGRSITGALESVAETAEASRARVCEARSALHAAIDARFNDIEKAIVAAEVCKVASLERELLAVDAALEHWRSESSAVCEAASSLSDDMLEAQQAALSSRLDYAEAQLQALPTAVVEPPFVGFVADMSIPLRCIVGFGRVLAPLPIHAADVRMELGSRGVRPGSTLRLRMSLGSRHAAETTEELEVSLGMLAAAIRIVATLDGALAEPSMLLATFEAAPAQRCLYVRLDIPADSGHGSRIECTVLSVAGMAVPGLSPVVISVRQAVVAPLLLNGSFALCVPPCISPDGLIFCLPRTGSGILVFNADGRSLPDLFCADFSVSELFCIAYANGDAPSLVLAGATDDILVAPRLAAVDVSSRAVRWNKSVGVRGSTLSISVFASTVVVACDDLVLVHRLSDGSLIGSFVAPELAGCIVVDPISGICFGNATSEEDEDEDEATRAVHAWYYDVDDSEAEAEIFALGPVAAAGSTSSNRILAVVPPAPGKTASHLVVGTDESSELLVLSLPGLVFIHSHILRGVRVAALVADPWGRALAVCDYDSQCIRVLTWPLPGMPPLL